MGGLDFTPLIYAGIVIGILIAGVLALLGWGGWWLLQHLAWVS